MVAVRILLLEDREDDEELLRAELRRARMDFELERVESRAELERALATGRWDVMLADYNLPSFDAAEALGVVRDSGLDVPVIVVSGSVGEEIAVQAMKSGASDYFRKDNIKRLAAAIEREVGEAQSRAQKRSLEAQLETMLAAERGLREEAERANRVKDEFLAMLSHELRTPLNAVLGRVHLLRRGTLRADAHEIACEAIERNAGSLAQIVDDLLDVSRMASGKLAIEHEPLPLEQVLADAIVAVVPLAEQKRLRIASSIEPLPQVIGDLARLRQALGNIIENAVKFTPAGGEIQIAARMTKTHALIEVADTGEGIEPDFLPHIFEWFRQADQSSKRRHGGLGLGLAIAQHIAVLHGGTLAAANAKYGGAVFTLALPIHDAVPAPLPPIAPAKPRGSLAGARILVVDDDRDSRELLGDLLIDHGATIRMAGSTPEALTVLADFQPEILITDIGMPVQDGYDLIRAVRGLPRDRGGAVQAIALTAYASAEDRAAAAQAGFQLHMAKPINPGKLLAAIGRLVARH